MTSVLMNASTSEIIAGYRQACALFGPCSDNGDGCSCTDSELAVRHFRTNLSNLDAETKRADNNFENIATIQRHLDEATQRAERAEATLRAIDAVAPDLPDALWNQIDACLSALSGDKK